MKHCQRQNRPNLLILWLVNLNQFVKNQNKGRYRLYWHSFNLTSSRGRTQWCEDVFWEVSMWDLHSDQMRALEMFHEYHITTLLHHHITYISYQHIITTSPHYIHITTFNIISPHYPITTLPHHHITYHITTIHIISPH